MEWILGISLVAVSVWGLRNRNRAKYLAYLNANVIEQNDQTWAADNATLLRAHMREIANELTQRDPALYRANFEKLLSMWQEIQALDLPAKTKKFDNISQKFPKFSNFILLSSWPHLIYSSAFSGIDDESLWQHYEQMRLYDALNAEIDPEWRIHSIGITQREHDNLRKQCCRISDTELLYHLYRAREQYRKINAENLEPNNDGNWHYETQDYCFKLLPSVLETRVGVFVKPLNRFGLWSFAVYDDVYTQFFAANSIFEEEHLDTMQSRWDSNKQELRTIEKIKAD